MKELNRQSNSLHNMYDLYQEELKDIIKNPHNKGTVSKPSVSVSKKNPMCGDELKLQLRIEKGLIKEAKFNGSACSVSVISASIFTDYLIGKNIKDIRKLKEKNLLDLVNLNLTTSRVACATLVFTALQEALKEYEEKNTKK